MKKVKIVYIVKNLMLNGISNVLINYCKYLDSNKFDITVIAGEPINIENSNILKDLNVKLIKIVPKDKKGIIEYSKNLINIFRKNSFDIIHIHGNSGSIALEIILAKVAGIKNIISHCHNTSTEHPIIHYIMKPVVNIFSNQKYACSEEAGKWLFYSDFNVINNGFEVDNFKFNKNYREKIREELKLKNEILIGHVGLFTEQKNHEFLISVFEKISTQYKNVKLLLVGGGTDFQKIKSKIDKSFSRDKIIIYGETNNVKPLYDAMDIFVFPSKYEGLGIAAVEAQISGLKCVVSDNVPKSIVIDNNKVRFLNLNDDINLWIDNIINQNLNDDRNSFFEKNKKSIERFSIKKIISNLEKNYINLMKG